MQVREASPAGTPTAAGGSTNLVFSRFGDTPADIAQRHGVSEAALREANPGMGQCLADGEPLRLPPGPIDGLTPSSAYDPLDQGGWERWSGPMRMPEFRWPEIDSKSFQMSAAEAAPSDRVDEQDGMAVGAGVAGAGGREAVVHKQMKQAYEAGRTAPQEAFDGKVYRAVPTQPGREEGALNHTRANDPNRYKSAGERAVYTSPDPFSAGAEARPYAEAGKAPMADKSVIKLHYKAAPNAEGRGGVADLREGARRVGLPENALTEPKGSKPPGTLYQLTGEHPYTLPQQAAKGAADAGASAIRAPSAEADHQINILPRNTRSDQVVPEAVVRHDAKGVPGLEQPAGHVQPMPTNDKPVVEGPLKKPAGDRKGPSVANQGPEKGADSPHGKVRQWANRAKEGYPRAHSGRYGAVGGAVAAVAIEGVNAYQTGHVDAASSAKRVGIGAAGGYAAARAADALTPRVGLPKAGGIVSGAVEGAISTYINVQAYRRGEVSGARAAANVTVDTGTAAVAGAAGAVAGSVAGAAVTGALVGSVVPVVGTAAGALVGLAVGTVAYLGVQAAANGTGLTQYAKDGLTGGFEAAGHAVGKVWNAVKFW